MKLKETLLNSTEDSTKIEIKAVDHVDYSKDIALRPDAFDIDDETKIELIEKHFREIMIILGLDLSDDSLCGTPHRVAKMYVKEMFKGLDPRHSPKTKMFLNKYKYHNILLEKNISFHSVCEHHFVPIIGKAHIAYIPNGQVVGLSKLNRIVRYISLRPQVQERMTIQVSQMLKEVLGTEDVAVIIEADHLCVAMRGVKDITSRTITVDYSGKFKEHDIKTELLGLIDMK